MRFRKIDQSTIKDHSFLLPEDNCIYLMEKTSGNDYSFSKANSIISNIKKKPSEESRPGYHYKAQDIAECSRLLREALNPEWLKFATLIPVPSSKAIGHPDYDDRMERICRGIGKAIDVRCLVTQPDSTVASHEVVSGERTSVESLLDLYEIERALSDPEPTQIGIVDDVLTTGRHFRAMHRLLSERFPKANITGIFVARRVFPNSNREFELR